MKTGTGFTFVPIVEGEGNSLLGMNGGRPESPDGRRLVYARKAWIDRPDHQRTELWICNRDLTGHRQIFEMDCGNHNGPSATFIDDRLVVFRGQDAKKRLGYFCICDVVADRVVYGPIYAKESHRAENGVYPFSVSEEHAGQNPDFPQIGDSGVYTLEVGTGKIKQVVDSRELLDFVRLQGLTPDENTTRMSHVQLNLSGTQVMLRISVKECKILGALACFDLESGERFLIPDKPIHQLWYDDLSYMAVYHYHDGRRVVKEASRINRYSRDGKVIEPLGGIGNHIDGSPDRSWLVADTAFPRSDIDILLYRKGNVDPVARLDTHRFESAVFDLKIHPNPTFSNDGKRIYFNRPVNERRTVAGYVDLSSLI